MKETRKGCVLFPARSTPPRVSFLKLEAVPAEPQACGPGPREDAGQGCGRTRVRLSLHRPQPLHGHGYSWYCTLGTFSPLTLTTMR